MRAMSWKDKEKQINAEAIQKGVNKPASKIMKESWQNLKDAFNPKTYSGTKRTNTPKSNEKRRRGGDSGY